jgi:hypothetical protein
MRLELVATAAHWNPPELARQEGRKVSPVSGPGELDFSQLPRWMARAHRHDLDIPESRARLVQVLKGPAGEKRVPFMADALPGGLRRGPRSVRHAQTPSP